MPLESYSIYHHSKTDQSVYTNQTKYIWLTTTFHLTLIMTSAQVVKMSVTTTDNSPSQDYTHPDDQTTLLHYQLSWYTKLLSKWVTLDLLVFFVLLSIFSSVYRCEVWWLCGKHLAHSFPSENNCCDLMTSLFIHSSCHKFRSMITLLGLWWIHLSTSLLWRMMF